jgi:hypothetical protein
MPTPIVDKSKLSGRAWWTANQGKALYSTSISIDKLDVTFKTKVTAFKKALTDAGAKISISTTRRSEARPYVLCIGPGKWQKGWSPLIRCLRKQVLISRGTMVNQLIQKKALKKLLLQQVLLINQA